MTLQQLPCNSFQLFLSSDPTNWLCTLSKFSILDKISLPTCSAKPIESLGALAMRTAIASYAAVRALPSLLVL